MRTIDAESLEQTILNLTNFKLSKIDVLAAIASEPTVVQEHRAGIEILTQMLENQSVIMSALCEMLPADNMGGPYNMGGGVWSYYEGPAMSLDAITKSNQIKYNLMNNISRTQHILRGKDA